MFANNLTEKSVKVIASSNKCDFISKEICKLFILGTKSVQNKNLLHIMTSRLNDVLTVPLSL